MSSPVIPVLVGEPSGKLRGKAAVRAYWAKALDNVPDLRFELVTALAGVDSAGRSRSIALLLPLDEIPKLERRDNGAI